MVRTVKLAGALVLTSQLLTGCGASGLPVTSVSASNASIAQGYRIGAGDKLRVTVFDEETLSGEYEIGDGGWLSLPLIDPIDAGNKTPAEVSQAVAVALSTGGFVMDPRVSIEILAYRPFFILGEVQTPGEYPYNAGLTLEQAVAKAGGYTARAAKNRVELQRLHWPSAKQVELDGQSLLIAPGDTIIIEQAFF